MSTPLKTTENMTKHLTAAERAARVMAERQLRRPRVQVRAPTWLGDDARKIFDTTKRRLAGLELLDTVDADLLALYSDAIANYKKIRDIAADDTKIAAVAQSWSRVALSYAEKLGISPSARARLARKKSEQVPPDDMEALLSDVTDFVNGDK